MTVEEAKVILADEKNHAELHLTRENATENYYKWWSDYVKALDMAISALSENKGEWIPIKEREPEVHKYVMFTTKTTRREIGYKAKEEPQYFLFGDSGAYVKSDYILAWMELPEPYKAESEGKE